MVRAIAARPNICGYKAYHTDGGVLLRPSSTVSDSKLPPTDLWVYKELGRRGTALTGYEVHSTYEDFTWDKDDTMSGAADDWTYEHLGVFSWTTEYWDVIHAATGVRAGTDIWFTGPTPEEEVAVAAWSDRFGEFYFPWRPFDHPQLGAVEIGGADWLHLYTNPPQAVLVDEIRPHAEFAVTQALAAPQLAVRKALAVPVGSGSF